MKVQLKRPPKERAEGERKPIELLEEGKYVGTFTKIEETGDEWDSLQVNMELEGVPEPTERWFRVFPASEAIRTLVDLAGGDSEEQETEFDPESLVGTKANVYIGTRVSKKAPGRTFNTIKKFSARRGK